MPTDDELDNVIDAVAPLLGLRVAPEWRAAVRLHLGISLAHAQAVSSVALADEAEPAPVFRA